MSTPLPPETIVTVEDTLRMLDALMEPREKAWWDGFYADRQRPVPFFADAPDESLAACCASLTDRKGRALDIGCGNGRNTRWLAQQGFSAVGIDFSAASIQWAAELSAGQPDPPQFVCCSLFDYTDAPKSFDLISDSGCFHHIKPHRRALYFEKVRTLLKEDGLFHLVCFNPQGGADISDYDVYRGLSMHGGLGFSEQKLRAILEVHFDILSLRQMRESTDPAVFGKDFMWTVLLRKKAAG